MSAALPCRTTRNADALWFSDSEHAQREAARRCFDCPIMDACATLGAGEEFGVWGGTLPRDRGLSVSRAARRAAEREALAAQIRTLFAEGMSHRAIKAELGVGSRFLADTLRAA